MIRNRKNRCCMHIRNSYIRNMYKILALSKKKSEVCLSLATNNKCKTVGDKLDAFCGKSRHTYLSENYLIDSSYRNITLSEPLECERSKYKYIIFEKNKQRDHDYATNYAKLMILL